ncbi:oligoribonuclease [Pseudobdellovibrio exovorus]|uniref:Oligoribonuclease n=1 Tax=Pseudobdellovibrio exovorus JSS TaxID=1184267 RepID=M4VRL5_9BACT|nr:oligoribonuclease [Pseudobdellovibrio exovorus]AGH95824.1 oligoribonuclease [Pseudobdellovibrio exovorus JSS]
MAYEKVENLFWLDMEMTGLDVNKEVVIEVACIITDMNFRELACFETVVKQPQSYLDNMDAWNKEHHGKSGLAAKVPNGMQPDMVEAKLIDLIDKHFPYSKSDLKKRPILAGNSIMQDRLFIDKYFKDLSARLHYRMVDVSSFKVVLTNKFEIEYKKRNSHRALDDIRESIGELKFYLDHINKPNNK